MDLEKFRFLTAGESHGKCLTAIIDGVPAGFKIDIDFINNELKRRQTGYGRGDRMKIETDKVEITAGVRFGITTGAPIALVIYNKDYENWQKILSTNPADENDEKSFTKYRPGHADYAGSVKYNQHDLRNILERSSARKTAIETAVGAVAKLILKQFNIKWHSRVLQIGSALIEEDFKEEIDRTKANGDTVGGKFEVVFENLPIGLGSCMQLDRKLDGRLAQAVMSIPAVKAFAVGDGRNSCEMYGSEFHDEMFLEDGKVVRKTNHAGGIEGGMTNGEALVIKANMKPIPTMRQPLKTVDSETMSETEAHFERSDTCAVEACSIVAEARVACVLANEMLMKYGGDSISEIEKNFKNNN